ncbi:MAG: hypothetical protein LIO77_05465, partial [Rikenellaceae bacterium]|nr:hypothetical protein [Rikenellaceae bacterium]
MNRYYTDAYIIRKNITKDIISLLTDAGCRRIDMIEHTLRCFGNCVPEEAGMEEEMAQIIEVVKDGNELKYFYEEISGVRSCKHKFEVDLYSLDIMYRKLCRFLGVKHNDYSNELGRLRREIDSKIVSILLEYEKDGVDLKSQSKAFIANHHIIGKDTHSIVEVTSIYNDRNTFKFDHTLIQGYIETDLPLQTTGYLNIEALCALISTLPVILK